jgi:putative restriction endonuclease
MPHLPALFTRLRAALPHGFSFQSNDDETHPALITVPKIGQVRVYLWTTTRSTGREMSDEFKIQLTLGKSRNLNLSPPHMTLLLGFSPEFGTFVAWEASLHEKFGSSPNVQVKEGLLVEARDSGWAVAPPRKVKAGREVRVAFSASNFGHYLTVTKEANKLDLAEEKREAHYLYRTPGTDLPNPSLDEEDTEDYAVRQRTRLTTTRLSRNSTFSTNVKQAYKSACAICGIQMEVVESAHIIEVCEEGSTDKVWNGIALCAVHHQLFDAHVLAIRPTFEIVVNTYAVDHLRKLGRGEGIDFFVTPYDGKELTKPKFPGKNPATLYEAMKRALEQRFLRTGLA